MASCLVVVALGWRCHRGTWSDFLRKLFLTIRLFALSSIYIISTIRGFTTLANTILQTIALNVG